MSIGDPIPYSPAWGWQWPQPAYTPPPCDHCLCIELDDEDSQTGALAKRTVPHNRCCLCATSYAVPRSVEETDTFLEPIRVRGARSW